MHSPTDRGARSELGAGSSRGWTATVEGETLVIESPEPGRELASSPACRETAVDVLATRNVGEIVVRHRVLEYRYDDRGVALLLAAGRFVDLCSGRDERLADLARRDPLEAAREATARGRPMAEVAAESGLALVAADVDGYDDVLHATVGFVDPEPGSADR